MLNMILKCFDWCVFYVKPESDG